MLAKATSAIFAVLLLSQLAPTSAYAAAPFRFEFNREELATNAGREDLEERLRSEVSAYCRRTGESSASLVQRGCRRTLIEATREALSRVQHGAA